MSHYLVDWAAALGKGARRVFGFLQVDIVSHSTLPGADRRISDTRDNFHKQVLGILTSHGGQELNWAGDGGAYLFLIDQSIEFDRMVTGALQVMDSLRLFNALRTLNTLDVPVRIRLSCHKGEAIWDPDLSNLYGKAVNYFLKADRQIGVDNRVTITEDVYEQLIEANLRDLFTPHREDNYHLYGRQYERTIYVCTSIDAIVRREYHIRRGDPLPTAHVVSHVNGAQRLDLMLAGGDSFHRQLFEALRHASSRSEPLQVRVLLRRSSQASSRSAKQFLALENVFNVKVSVRWYDWDFMLRGYCFDRRVAFVSYFLREGEILSGRYNPMMRVVRDLSQLDDFILDTFCQVFDVHFSGLDSDRASPVPPRFIEES